MIVRALPCTVKSFMAGLAAIAGIRCSLHGCQLSDCWVMDLAKTVSIFTADGAPLSGAWS